MRKGTFLWLSILLGAFAGLLLTLVGCNPEGRFNPTDSDVPKKASTEAKHLSEAEAREVALTFLGSNTRVVPSLRATAANLKLAFAEPVADRALRAQEADALTDSRSNLPAYYVFNVGEEGFVVVSAWDVTFPILGFSEEGKFFGEEVATGSDIAEANNVMSFLSSYAASIDSLRQVTPVTKELRAAYSDAVNNGVVVEEALRAYNNIAPLLGNINWNQSPYYNAYCPKGTPVGCVATATTMIMKYWGHPARGTGSHTSTYDGQFANFNKAYNWANMPGPVLRGPNHDIAQLSYDVAVGLNMMFAPGGSGTYQYHIPPLLRDHFYYKNTIRQYYRSNFNTARWTEIVYNELDNRRPVQYAGAGNGGGHSFVCDGYRNGYFHINWGWGGMSNGYFLLHALDPNSLGTGGGSGGFNYGQDIIVGIEPDNRNPNPNPDPDPQPNPGASYLKGISLSQFKSMLSFPGGNKVRFGYGVKGPMVLYVMGTGCSYCEQVHPAVELLGKEFNGKLPFYEFDVITNGQWGVNWDYAQRVLGIETVPQLLFIDKNGNYTIMSAVVSSNDARANAAKFRPYIQRILDGGVDPEPTPDPTPSGDYCVSKGKYPQSTFIAQVSLANVNNFSRGSDNGYTYFSNKTIELEPGKTYNITLKPGSTSGNYREYFRVWLDVDGDKEFSSRELLLDINTAQSNVAVTRQVTIPSNVTKGASRLRVQMKWGSTPYACETFDYGEVEDYPVVFKSQEPEPTPDPTPDPEVDPYPVSYGKDSYYGYISEVKIGDMQNRTKGDKYASYITTHHINAQKGRAVTFQLTPSFGSTSTYWCYWRIWIDYNRDGKFTSNELVTSKYGYRSVSGWFTVPYSLGQGYYRVRVSMKMNDGYPAPDEVFNYGEVEDYRLFIK